MQTTLRDGIVLSVATVCAAAPPVPPIGTAAVTRLGLVVLMAFLAAKLSTLVRESVAGIVGATWLVLVVGSPLFQSDVIAPPIAGRLAFVGVVLAAAALGASLGKEGSPKRQQT